MKASRKKGLMRLGAIVVALVLIVTTLSLVALSGTAPAKKPVHRTVTASKPFPGPDGVVAPWVVAENKKPGTTDWQISPAVAPNAIAGFANLNYAQVGQHLTFYVTTPSPTFTVTAYRMGYYGGKGARQIWTSPAYPGVVQPTCPLTPGVNMTSCDNWTPSLTIPITKRFVQGDYLFKLVGSGGQQGYVPLTVIDPTSTATYLVVNRTFTEQGWNAWGGFDFYQGQGPCAPTVPKYPQCNRARAASYDRPYDTGYGASDYMGNEYPLIAFMEQHGLDLTYVTDVTLDANPSLQSNHKVLLSLGHDETWSTPQRQGAEAAQAKGVNLVFFGAASVLRHVRMESSPLGPERIEINYRSSQEDPLNGTGNPLDVTGNSFAVPPTNWSEIPFTGEEYSGYLSGASNVPFVVADGSAWVFKGTGLKTGSQIPGVIMSDIDHVDIAGGSPTNIQILGHSPIPLSTILTNQGKWGPYTYSDMTYYTDPASKSGVIDTGTVSWISSMSFCTAGVVGCDPSLVRAITGNILRVFGTGPAGLVEPSVPNWSTIQPPGS